MIKKCVLEWCPETFETETGWKKGIDKVQKGNKCMSCHVSKKPSQCKGAQI